MKIRKCNLRGVVISPDPLIETTQPERPTVSQEGSVSFGVYDLCGNCTTMVRRATCLKCEGSGRIRVRDDDASSAQATCGENRTEYKTIDCDCCPTTEHV